jgi:hypothetical protein
VARRGITIARSRRTALRQLITTVVVTGVLGSALVSCVVQRLTGPRITGTCDGACAHYVQCKPGHSDADRSRCTTECPDVFADRDSLMAYESLSCDDAVEFVDGSNAKTAAHRGP